MIDPAIVRGLDRIGQRERDVLHAYEPGFVPEASDAAVIVKNAPSADPLSAVAPEGAYFLTPASDGSVEY